MNKIVLRIYNKARFMLHPRVTTRGKVLVSPLTEISVQGI